MAPESVEAEAEVLSSAARLLRVPLKLVRPTPESVKGSAVLIPLTSMTPVEVPVTVAPVSAARAPWLMVNCVALSTETMMVPGANLLLVAVMIWPGWNPAVLLIVTAVPPDVRVTLPTAAVVPMTVPCPVEPSAPALPSFRMPLLTTTWPSNVDVLSVPR